MEENLTHIERIRKYLAGEMTPEERQDFESKTKEDKDLRELLTDLSILYKGEDLLQSIEADHIDSQQLALYAENQSSLPNDTQTNIRQHLKSCPECREELALCRKTLDTIKPLKPDTSKSWLARMMDSLLTPRPILRPVYAAAVLFIIAVPIYLIVFGTFRAEQVATVSHLEPVARSTIDSIKTVTLSSEIKLVPLEFYVPLPIEQDSALYYDFELFDSKTNLILALPNNPPKKPFALDVPRSYLSAGDYTLKVWKVENGIRSNQSRDFRFRVIVND